MEACFRGHLESAKLVVHHGGSWLSRDYCGFSSLHYAVDGGHLHVVSHILSEGVAADEVGENTLSGWTPLMRTGIKDDKINKILTGLSKLMMITLL